MSQLLSKGENEDLILLYKQVSILSTVQKMSSQQMRPTHQRWLQDTYSGYAWEQKDELNAQHSPDKDTPASSDWHIYNRHLESEVTAEVWKLRILNTFALYCNQPTRYQGYLPFIWSGFHFRGATHHIDSLRFSISLEVLFVLPSRICSETSFRGTLEKRISVEFLTLVPFWQISS